MPITADLLFFITEMIGTVAFAISGAMIAIERKLDLFGVLFLGATTAIGGGIVRDVLLGQVPPRAFLNYVYMLTAVISAAFIFLLIYLNTKQEIYLSNLRWKLFDMRVGARNELIRIKNIKSSQIIGDYDFGQLDNDFLTAFAEGRADTFDDGYFPTKGVDA